MSYQHPAQYLYYAQQVHPPSPPLESKDTTLVVRQEPKEALVLLDNKEKTRKPIDPPPVVQILVHPSADSSQNFLQSPYLFVVAALWRATQDGPDPNWPKNLLVGNISSSIHRLKDADNKDGGFFVFGDVSVKIQGSFRLHFTLYDLHLKAMPRGEAFCLASVTSKPFKVIPQKEFKGLDESTYLSRAFSDQGVRLRLRKEPRRKRALDFDEQEEGQEADLTTPNIPYNPVRTDSGSHEDHMHVPLKRQQTGEVDEHDLLPPFQPKYEDRSLDGYSSYPQTQFSLRPAPNYGLPNQNVIPQYPQGGYDGGAYARGAGFAYSGVARYSPQVPTTTQSFDNSYSHLRPSSTAPGYESYDETHPNTNMQYSAPWQ